jgi:hypothetical protein
VVSPEWISKKNSKNFVFKKGQIFFENQKKNIKLIRKITNVCLVPRALGMGFSRHGENSVVLGSQGF